MIYLTHDNGTIQVISVEYFQGATQYKIDDRIKYDVLNNPQYYRIENDTVVTIANEVSL